MESWTTGSGCLARIDYESMEPYGPSVTLSCNEIDTNRDRVCHLMSVCRSEVQIATASSTHYGPWGQVLCSLDRAVPLITLDGEKKRDTRRIPTQ